ncbi:MAG: ribonuclease HII [Candidatus Omnitrophota bacterium]
MEKRRKHSPHALTKFERKNITLGYKLIAGIDEAGVGPWAGPVVAAAVILRDFRFKSRIYDSKLLTPKSRQRALGELKKKAHIGIGIVDHKRIDSLNIYRATRLAMERALRALKPKPDFFLVDGLIKPRTAAPSQNVIGGDRKSMSIAAASIVAKVLRDGIMEGYDLKYPGYGFAKHKGYGTKEHRVALEKLGPCRIHRRSYAPVKVASKLFPT